MDTHAPRTRKAFTLVELLVVVAIIALLIAILLPALNNARDVARRVVCAGNSRNLSMAHIMYASDNQDCLMGMGRYTNGFKGHFLQNPTFQVFFTDYINGGDLKLVGSSWPHPSKGIRYAVDTVLQCPSKPREDLWYAGYVMCAGSAEDYGLTIRKAEDLVWKYSDKTGSSMAALFADRIVPVEHPSTGLYRRDTNHWDDQQDMPLGGNVAYSDGSAGWMRYDGKVDGGTNALNTFVTDGAIFNIEAWPTASVIIETGGDRRADSRGRMQIGLRRTHTADELD